MATHSISREHVARESQNPQSALLKAAKAAYSALLLAVPDGERNTIVRTLGQAIRDLEGPPPKAPAPARRSPQTSEQIRAASPLDSAPIQKLTMLQAADLLKELRSESCNCGRSKVARQPFCANCYHALPAFLRAKMWLSPLDGDEILYRILEARAWLERAGMYSREGVA